MPCHFISKFLNRIFWQIHNFGSRVAEVVQRHTGPSPKSLDSDKKFKPELTPFCCELRFFVIYALYGDLWAKKVPFWVKQCFLGKKCTITL